MIKIKDQIGRTVQLPASAKRIVCLVPSITELLFDLGVGLFVVGRTKFCVHPQPDVSSTPRIGGTKTVKVAAVRDQRPDLIIASKEENVEEQVLAACNQEEGQSGKTPVYVSNVTDLRSAVDMILDIGQIVGRSAASQDLADQIMDQAARIHPRKTESALYLIWKKPYMSVGGDTYISAMMPYAGYENVLSDRQRYPTVEPEEIKALQPKHILLSSEPFPFSGKHIKELQQLCPDADVRLVDGEHYSWYGSRMLTALQAFTKKVE